MLDGRVRQPDEGLGGTTSAPAGRRQVRAEHFDERFYTWPQKAVTGTAMDDAAVHPPVPALMGVPRARHAGPLATG
ncbi:MULTISPECIES: hypothetical protein [unclassified Nonomuraea]|uniref:hypothetical protein n=1 Tax=unclassified Nonomuraea TaxID=2593643 RepID=UPI0013765412|nr:MULTISPECIES: hypothetical protein [unclassified Nonomuraea]NBE99881.1 hypothetical protein [Nonomuraea sp. K271]